MRVKVILNPYANRWGAQERQTAVAAACRAAGLEFDIHVTHGPGEGTEVAKTAVSEQYSAVIAAGGDGTISEVANGLLAVASEGQPTLPLGIFPIGSANDFAKMLNYPLELEATARYMASGKTRQIDVGRMNVDGRIHYFNNNSALAMEPMVTLEHIKITRISGELRYLVALLRGIIKLKAWQMEIVWDDGRYDGPTFLLSVCNGPRTGGFMMSPGAEFDDGLLNYVLAPEVSKGTFLGMLLRLMKGTHLSHPKVISGATRRLAIRSQPGTPIHADGEILSETAKVITYEVLPDKLTLLGG
ncbi:MAG: diacylglycerol kinase family lipid kinase [Chloroflexi bacterium]|nr:diacylglycerol kinase family lipid kinase [Chloroflexota bacterium]